MTTLLEALESVKETLRTPGAWTREEYAIDGAGCVVEPDDPTATSFCLLGAIVRAEPCEEDWGGVTTAIQSAINDLFTEYSSIATFNDAGEIEHSDVIKVLDQAIDAAS